MIGYAICGSFCTHKKSLRALTTLKHEGWDILPVVSEISANTDTRFGSCQDLIRALIDTTGNAPVLTIPDAEPLGPSHPLEAMIIAPCTGNTLAKLAHSIADTSVTMAVKSHLRNGRPVLIAVSTNDALAGAAENIGKLMARKNYYFVPFRQDDPAGKPTSMVASTALIPDAIQNAVTGNQMQPMIVE